jgi:hypothetical protein
MLRRRLRNDFGYTGRSHSGGSSCSSDNGGSGDGGHSGGSGHSGHSEDGRRDGAHARDGGPTDGLEEMERADVRATYKTTDLYCNHPLTYI